MATQLTLASLLTVATAEEILARGLTIADALGLDTTTWRTGDPTRSLYHFMAEVLATQDAVVVRYIAGGLLEEAEGDQLTLLAAQVYGVTRGEASYAGSDLELTNAEGGVFVFDAGDITFRSSVTGKTYHNTSGGTLSSFGTLDVDWIADEPGSDSAVSEDDIDEMVTTFIGVSVTASGASTATDAESDSNLKVRCRDSLGALSPDGPADAYRYVALTSELTGDTETTKASVEGDNATGDVTVYIAGSGGAVTSGARDAVADAIAIWATPLCITPTVVAASEETIAITATVYIHSTVGELDAAIESAIETKLAELFDVTPIGGNAGYLHRSIIVAEIKATFPDHIYNVVLAAPAADVALLVSEVAVLGTTTITVVQVDP